MEEFNLIKSLLGMSLIHAEWVLWFLIFLSILSFAIMLERAFYYFRHRMDYSLFVDQLNQRLAEGDLTGARDLCLNRKALAAKVALVGLENHQRGLQAMQGAMEGTIVREQPKLDQGLMILGTLGNNAPFIGLFGTVIGIIKAFHDLALKPEGGSAVVMTGISEALVATAVGLFVAIPAVIAFNAMTRNVKKQISGANGIVKLLSTYLGGRN